MLRVKVLKDLDRLQHDKENGFYDKDLDMFFDTIDQWLKFKWNLSPTIF